MFLPSGGGGSILGFLQILRLFVFNKDLLQFIWHFICEKEKLGEG